MGSSYPRHLVTGSGGYFGYSGSFLDRSHIEKLPPRVFLITFW